MFGGPGAGGLVTVTARPGKSAQVGLLGSVQPEHLGDRVEYFVRRVLAASLLKADIVVDTDPCELGDLFPPQPGYTPPTMRGPQTHLFRLDPGSPRPQEVTERVHHTSTLSLPAAPVLVCRTQDRFAPG